MANDITNDAERQLDELIALIGKRIETEDQRVQIMNLPRVKQLEFAYEVLKILLAGQDALISYKLNDPFKSIGSVSIEGRNVAFSKIEWFIKAANVADNMEVYPLTNGKLRMTLTFHNVTTAM